MSRISTKRGVIGIDEVGRGPLAGPITVCAVYIQDTQEVLETIFHNTIRDSKKIKKDERIKIYKTIRKKRLLKTRIEYAVSSRSATYIDMFGINRAATACILSCLKSLEKKGIPVATLSINLDAGLVVDDPKLSQRNFIKGDEHFVEIAVASIMAKVTRDTYMERLAVTYEGYMWDKNVGYGTKFHREMIKKRGVTKYHRMTYLKGFKLFDKTE